jgi:transcriptional regulator with XRE-family HTH domain
MNINEVIRKYRKEKNMTQEEMANRLGVTAPAVNKWESGASMPDISLLAPIARLLGISLDELLSFNESLSEIEEKGIINEVNMLLNTQPMEVGFKRITDIVKEYPNAENLILSLVTVFAGRRMVFSAQDMQEYEKWIHSTYKNLQGSNSEFIRHRATDGLYAYYISREQYAEAEECLEYYSADDPDRKRKLAPILYGTGKYEEAYKTIEELLFSDYQRISVGLNELFTVAIKNGDYEKAKKAIEKVCALAKLFEMGKYHENASRVSYASAMKDADEALRWMDELLGETDTLMDFTKSDLYEHMDFNPMTPMLAEMVKTNQLKHYLEDEDYRFVRESAGWEDFKKKWYK